MTFVIAEPCVGVKDGSCAGICPVECIHTDPGADMYFIDPHECIDCGVCVVSCPVGAIYPEDELPDRWRRFTDVNAGFFGPDEGFSGAPVPRRRGPSGISGDARAQPPLDDGDRTGY